MHMETAKQVAYWSTSCLCQSLLLRGENKTDILQGVFIRIIILKARGLHLHSKLAQLWHTLCSLKYWTEAHILGHGKPFLAYLSLPLTFICRQVVGVRQTLFPVSSFPQVVSKVYFVATVMWCSQKCFAKMIRLFGGCRPLHVGEIKSVEGTFPLF